MGSRFLIAVAAGLALAALQCRASPGGAAGRRCRASGHEHDCLY
jgi:hypothetical protein